MRYIEKIRLKLTSSIIDVCQIQFFYDEPPMYEAQNRFMTTNIFAGDSELDFREVEEISFLLSDGTDVLISVSKYFNDCKPLQDEVYKKFENSDIFGVYFDYARFVAVTYTSGEYDLYNNFRISIGRSKKTSPFVADGYAKFNLSQAGRNGYPSRLYSSIESIKNGVIVTGNYLIEDGSFKFKCLNPMSVLFHIMAEDEIPFKRIGYYDSYTSDGFKFKDAFALTDKEDLNSLGYFHFDLFGCEFPAELEVRYRFISERLTCRQVNVMYVKAKMAGKGTF